MPTCLSHFHEFGTARRQSTPQSSLLLLLIKTLAKICEKGQKLKKDSKCSSKSDYPEDPHPTLGSIFITKTVQTGVFDVVVDGWQKYITIGE